ncbi:MAG: hypothetical protein Q7T73_06795 [Beijerinckiaceae bacterium]|nr:hypothetical protein [Beijerinckiaceae bacterium]
MANRRPADWRFPNEKQQRAEETARRMQAAAAAPPTPAVGPADPMPDSYWDAVLADPVARARPGVLIQNRRLSEIPRHVLRVSCRRCDRIVEIQTADAVRLFGGGVTWKDAGMRILDGNCNNRTGSRDDDGCWPDYRV